MHLSLVPVLLAVALLSSSHPLLSLASPRLVDSRAEQDVLAQALFGDDAAEGTVRDVTPRVIVVGEASLWGALRALEKAGLPHPAEGLLPTAERRDTSQQANPSFSVLRRDTMRCMVGRVYRPCWEV